MTREFSSVLRMTVSVVVSCGCVWARSCVICLTVWGCLLSRASTRLARVERFCPDVPWPGVAVGLVRPPPAVVAGGMYTAPAGGAADSARRAAGTVTGLPGGAAPAGRGAAAVWRERVPSWCWSSSSVVLSLRSSSICLVVCSSFSATCAASSESDMTWPPRCRLFRLLGLDSTGLASWGLELKGRFFVSVVGCGGVFVSFDGDRSDVLAGVHWRSVFSLCGTKMHDGRCGTGVRGPVVRSGPVVRRIADWPLWSGRSRAGYSRPFRVDRCC